MKTYRVGIIGLGRMGSTIDEEGHSDLPYSIAAACWASERLEVAAGCDLQADRREAFRAMWDVPALYESYLDMVEKEAPDLVAVCTTASGLFKPARSAPDAGFRGDSHAELAIGLAEAGVPMLYVEKAMASSMQKADEVRQACHGNAALLNTGVLRRFDNRYQVVREAIVAGRIGEPTAVVHFAASSLMHGHIHSIDTISYLLGDPEILSVRGELLPRGLEIEHRHLAEDPQATFQLILAGDVEAWSVPAAGWEFEVLGTEGSIRSLNNGAGAALRRQGGSGPGREPWEETAFEFVTPRSPVVSCLEDLVEAHETGRLPLGHVDLTCHITEACIAVAESHARGGVWVDLPLAARDLYIFHV